MSGEIEDDSGNHDGDDSEVEEAMDDDEDNHSVSDSPPNDSDRLSDDSDDTPLVFKRPRIDRTDRFSRLPDPVIVYILSFLPIVDSIRTGSLSRRWQYLWTHVPTLNFTYCDFRRRRRYDLGDIVNFVEWVDKTLVLCDGSVKILGVNFPYLKQFASSSHLWSRFASRNGVEKFELVFQAATRLDADIYVLPQFLFTNSVFRELHFSLCRFEPKTTVAWSSLKKLSIGNAELSDDVIQRILAGTPVLEMLELYCFTGIKRLHMGNSSVKKLILRGRELSHADFEPMELEISAPSVQSLEISGNFPNCQLVDIKSLAEAKLFRLYLKHSTDDDLVNKARCLLDSLAHVETLTLGTWAIMELAMLHTKRLSPRLLKCGCLTLDTNMWSFHPLGLGMAILLRYFPLLQTLTVTETPLPMLVKNIRDFGSCLRSVEEEFSAVPIPFAGFALLRTVKFVCFGNSLEHVSQFVPIVLKNARILQKMIIHTGTRDSGHHDPNKLFKAAQKLLSFPRSSPDAQLLVYE